MVNDKSWFSRQLSSTAEDLKKLPDWNRTRSERTDDHRSAVSEPRETKAEHRESSCGGVNRLR
jgi:hypothetical protein